MLHLNPTPLLDFSELVSPPAVEVAKALTSDNLLDLGSIFPNSVSAENVSDNFSSSNFGPISTLIF
jgi:hypothetical protein